MYRFAVPILLLTLFACSPSERNAADLSADSAALSGDALFADVARYHAFGNHQTASDGDGDTATWIAQELGKAGYDTAFQTWKLRQFSVDNCRVTVNDIVVDSYPFWYPNATGDEGLRGTLTVMPESPAAGSMRGRVALVPSEDTGGGAIYSVGVNALASRAKQAGAVALVVVVPSQSGELAAINARDPYHQEPLPLPSVIVAMKDEATLRDAASIGHEATVVISGWDDEAATSQNVIGTLERGPKWIVVTTPSSGWFTCAGERGPGVALFLGLARWAAESDSPYSFRFIANSGHELDNLGAHDSLEKYGPPVEDVACWLHLGASIATREWARDGDSWKALDTPNPTGNLVATEGLLPAVDAAFGDIDWLAPRSGEPIRGELQHFINKGYTAFGFFGGHHYFHTQHDTPETTSPRYLEQIARATATVLAGI